MMINIKKRNIWLLLSIWFIAPYNVYGDAHYQQSSDGDDWLLGSSVRGGSILKGNKGNDHIYGGLGDDALYGGSGDDVLYGWDGDDTIRGGTGDNYIHDSHGNNTYQFGIGDGNSFISSDKNIGFGYGFEDSSDILQFLSGIQPEDVRLSRVDTDENLQTDRNLLVTFEPTCRVIVLPGYFNNDYRATPFLSAIKFSDGAVWDTETIEKIVNTATPSSCDKVGKMAKDNTDIVDAIDTTGYSDFEIMLKGFPYCWYDAGRFDLNSNKPTHSYFLDRNITPNEIEDKYYAHFNIDEDFHGIKAYKIRVPIGYDYQAKIYLAADVATIRKTLAPIFTLGFYSEYEKKYIRDNGLERADGARPILEGIDSNSAALWCSTPEPATDV